MTGPPSPWRHRFGTTVAHAVRGLHHHVHLAERGSNDWVTQERQTGLPASRISGVRATDGKEVIVSAPTDVTIRTRVMTAPAGSLPTELDLEMVTRPLLAALARFAHLESTYLTVFDWDRREEEVRFVFSTGETWVEEGQRIAMPTELSPDAFAGVTRSPETGVPPQPDGVVAKRLGLKTYLSVPVTIGKHRLFGMLCGASRQPEELSETVVGIFESFAEIVASHVARLHQEETESRATGAEIDLLTLAHILADAEVRLKTPLTVLQGVALILRDRRDDLSESERVRLHDSLVRNVQVLSHEVEDLMLGARVGGRADRPHGEDRGVQDQVDTTPHGSTARRSHA